MKQYILILVLLIGCTNPDVIYIDRNNTIYINRTINITINDTPPCKECLSTECEVCQAGNYGRDYVLGLIRQVKRLEKNRDKYWNNSECFDELNKTSNKLQDCEHELCYEWNSSWC